MKNKQQGQAVMEFISVYGWVILVVLFAIGVLFYFGVFTPNYLTPVSGICGEKVCEEQGMNYYGKNSWFVICEEIQTGNETFGYYKLRNPKLISFEILNKTECNS